MDASSVQHAGVILLTSAGRGSAIVAARLSTPAISARTGPLALGERSLPDTLGGATGQLSGSRTGVRQGRPELTLARGVSAAAVGVPQALCCWWCC